MNTACSIAAMQLNDDQRINHPAELFGIDFPFRLEPAIYAIAQKLSRDYRGGYWEMYALCNGGFYMAPDWEGPFHVRCENGFQGILSADALGVTACLYAYSMMSFGDGGGFADRCAEHFHLLRDYAIEHPEVAAILQAID
jgi:hypothetical protein